MKDPAGLFPATIRTIRRLTTSLMDTDIQELVNPPTTLFFTASPRNARLVKLVSL